MSKDSEKSHVDKLIDLRIAMESLYDRDSRNDKYKQEKRFRISLIGAWHLGANFADRRRIFGTLRDAYDSASVAVHGGDLDKDEIEKILEESQELCRQGILKLLQEGFPNWGDLILGAKDNAKSV